MGESELTSAYDTSNRPRMDDYNGWADFWRNSVGVNVIPANTAEKKTHTEWIPWQNKPIPQEIHDSWKQNHKFDNGLAIIPGKVWHRPDKMGQFFVVVDLDKETAIEEMCTRDGKTTSIKHMASKFLIEQHKDDPDRAHICFYSPIPFVKKSPDGSIGIEVKSAGEHGISFCCPSIHKNKDPADTVHRYEIIGILEPITLTAPQANEMMQHINRICLKFGVNYLDKDRRISRMLPMIQQLKVDPDIRILQGERHLTLLAVADSLLLRHSKKGKTESRLKEFFAQINHDLCDPVPLSEDEINAIWLSATEFVSNVIENDEEKGLEPPSIIEIASEAIMEKYKLLTIEESKEIRCYHNGVYVPGGEILIEKVAEAIYGYDLANRHLSEIKGHIMRKTYRQRAEIDADINIINLKNGLYNIQTGEFKEHIPDYLSINQVPIVYNPKATPQLFGQFLSQVLYPQEIRTAVELMAYTFYRDNLFEIITILFGYGANGKSVFTGLLTALHGAKNVSNVPLSAMLDDRFALSDLEGKSVNIDTEVTSTTIRDTSVLKKITGRQPIRIQRKNERAYDALLHTKLFFSANKIPMAYDESDAFFRRKVILSFPNKFEGDRGPNRDDPDLLKKLTTEEEISGVFNVLMMALKRLLTQNRIFTREKTIEQRRERYTTAASPIEAFLEDAIAEDSVVSDTVVKERLYQAYKRFCNKHNLAILSKENLGKILKKKYKEDREPSGKRQTLWKGMKLKEEYDINTKQETLDGSTHTAGVATTITATNDGNNHELNISCYYCSYQTNDTKEYEGHVVLKHRKKPAYPGKADMEGLGLSPKGNSWEAAGA
jgi:P4 family phage/plasmid primase-like protien